jgi:hypothetical protein
MYYFYVELVDSIRFLASIAFVVIFSSFECFPPQSISQVDYKGCFIAMVARGAYQIYQMFPTFSSWTHRVVPPHKIIVGGSEKSVGVPEHKIELAIRERQGDKESPKDSSRLKSCEPLYTCPCAPFYREMKGLFTFRDYPRI